MSLPDFLGAKEFFLFKTGALDQIKDAIIAVDNQDQLTYLNKAAAQQYNIDKNKALGLKLTQLYRQLWFSPEDEHKALLALKEKGTWEGVNIHLQPSGEKAVIESVVSVVKDEAGNKIGLLSIMRDITQRINVDSWLAESNQRLNYVIEAAAMMVYEIDYKTNQVTIIRGLDALLGYDVDEVSSTVDWWINQIHPDDVSKAKEQFYPTKAADNVISEYRIHHKSDNYIVVQGVARVLKDKKGNPTRLIGGMQDVTKYKQMHDSLEEYAKNLEKLVDERTRQLQGKERLAAIGATAGMVGHDIRNPLQAIVGDLYLLNTGFASRLDIEDRHIVQESLDAIEKNIEYINKIVADLQDYAKPMHPTAHQVNFKEIVTEVLTRNRLPDNIKVQTSIEEDATILIADSTYLNRIINNLVTNAAQAMPQGGKLTIQAYKDKQTNQTTITVEDTGKGIPKEVHDKLFTPLFTTKSKGQGFGLAVVKRMVEALGGVISFESKEGKGTKFIVILPAQKN